MSDLDVKQYLARQRAQWDQGAEGWLRWRHTFAQRTDDRALVDAVGVKPGDDVLDVGAGSGDPALALARAVGPEGYVVATDLSPAMLAVAQARAGEEGLENIAVRAIPAEDLDFVQGSFDAAVSSFTLMLIADPVSVARQIHRFLRPGGRFAVSVWATPDKVPMLSMPAQIIFSELGIAPPSPEGPGLFALGDPSRLKRVLEEAGFSRVSVWPLPYRFRFEKADDYGVFIRDVAIVLSGLVAEHAPKRQEEIWEKVSAYGRERAAPDGSLTFENEAFIATGTRAS